MRTPAPLVLVASLGAVVAATIASGPGAPARADGDAPGPLIGMRGALLGERTASARPDRGQPALDLAAARADRARIERLLEGHTTRDDEGRILRLLRAADAPRLDWLVRNLDLDALLDGVDDRLFGPDNRTELLGLLSGERLDDLSVPARAALIDSLQSGHTDGLDERTLTAVILGTRGAALTDLKKAIDAGGDHRDLLQLVHHDLDDAGARRAILDHIAREARPTGELEVLSDIDDTLYPSFKDRRWPRGAPYPGARAFYAALDGSVLRAGGPVADGGRPGDLVFITARPGDRGGLVEDGTHRTLAGFGVGDAVVLAGSFTALIGNERIAARKYRNFIERKELYPEYRYVFVGDSGQGDAIFGARMRREHPAAVPAVFIHDVVGTPWSERARWRAQGVFFFDTYAGAAVEAHTAGLITDRALRTVVSATLAELDAAAFDAGDARRAARRAELSRDVARANARIAIGD